MRVSTTRPNAMAGERAGARPQVDPRADLQAELCPHHWLRARLRALLESHFPASPPVEPQVTVPRQSGQGELSTNVAMVAAPLLGRTPKELAATLAAALAPFEEIETVEVAPPAFINVTLTELFWKQRALATVALGDAFDELPLGQGRCVNVEYVSANPTGPCT